MLPDRLLLAQQQRMEPQELLLFVLHDEMLRRQSTASTRRAHHAGLDPDMAFERWDPSAKVSFDARVLTELRSLRFITEHKNALILGPLGVGKSFLANALGHLACRHRYPVLFVRADERLRRLKQTRLDNSREAVMSELVGPELPIPKPDVPIRQRRRRA